MSVDGANREEGVGKRVQSNCGSFVGVPSSTARAIRLHELEHREEATRYRGGLVPEELGSRNAVTGAIMSLPVLEPAAPKATGRRVNYRLDTRTPT